MDKGTAAEGMARLSAERSKASARVASLEASARSARDQLVQAREVLVSFEGSGSTSTSERRRLEQALAAAHELAGQPWPERTAGARRRVRAAQEAMQRFVGENLAELV